MSDMMSIGAAGLRAYQVALNTVSDNISNAGTAGYSRRVASTKEVAAVGRNNDLSGLGSLVSSVGRVSDYYRSAEVRSSGSDLAKTEASVTWLQRVEDSLSGTQLGTRMSSFFTAATTLAADPTSSGARASMLEAASGVADAFSDTGAALDQISVDLDGTARSSVETLNTSMAALSKVNDGLARAQPGTAGQAALMDQRDQLLEQMSAVVDISVDFDGLGRATVHGGGSAGPTLVDVNQAAIVTYSSNGSGAVSFNVVKGANYQSLTPAGGALAGLTDAMQRLADAKTTLSQVASDFVDGVNMVQAAGRDLNNNAGAPMFAISTTGGTAQVSMLLDDPNTIAAAAVGGGTRDNTNLAALASLRTSANYEGRVVDLTTANAATLAQRKAVADAQSTIHNNAVAARDAVSGVDLDSEAVDLMRFQQAYTAASRVIQVSRETIQSILDIH